MLLRIRAYVKFSIDAYEYFLTNLFRELGTIGYCSYGCLCHDPIKDSYHTSILVRPSYAYWFANSWGVAYRYLLSPAIGG